MNHIQKTNAPPISRSTLILMILGIAVFLVDFASKYFIQKYIPIGHSTAGFPYDGIGIFKNFIGIEFSVIHATNKGAAWGLFANFQTLLMAFRIIFVSGLGVYSIFFNQHKEWRIPLTLIFAGAIGNIVDYFLYGYVIDFLQFNFWGYDYPVFNIADSAIFIGISWILISSFFKDKKREYRQQ